MGTMHLGPEEKHNNIRIKNRLVISWRKKIFEEKISLSKFLYCLIQNYQNLKSELDNLKLRN